MKGGLSFLITAFLKLINRELNNPIKKKLFKMTFYVVCLESSIKFAESGYERQPEWSDYNFVDLP